ncbi:hypothetical protein Dcar01_02688 [Deinococcus carri]|uniref:Tetratricopeptide repeat protein n=1 Tax=Deinococcus carri TaxID=1211323 RepID=A0ABP9W9B7_9DEIO
MTFPELLAHIGTLLAAQEWQAASLHVRRAAQEVTSRAGGKQLREVVLSHLPPQQRGAGEWPHALAWTAYRSGDLTLLGEVLDALPGGFPAFEAFRASLKPDWAVTRDWAAQARLDGADRAVAARFHACALAALDDPAWPAAFEEARQASGRRDRGLLHLELACHLINVKQEAAARDALARAVPDLRGDPWAQTLVQANLGISCLRLGDLGAAERALREAVRWGEHPEGRASLSAAWQGLGGLYLQQGQLARAAHAYSEAHRKAEFWGDRRMALRAQANVHRLRGELDEALSLLHDALAYEEALEGQPHPLYADLAALRLLAGDPAGARACLAQVRAETIKDTWRAQVVRAELRRRAGEGDVLAELQDLDLNHTWTRQEAWAFPELFAPLGLPGQPPPWTATVTTDGPVRLSMNGVDVPLPPTRPEASLLAFLLLHGGQASVERVLEGVTLPGTTPRRQRQALSKVVAALREVLAWPGAVQSGGSLLTLSKEVEWTLVTPPPGRTDTFCEGLLDEWVVQWRNDSI